MDPDCLLLLNQPPGGEELGKSCCVGPQFQGDSAILDRGESGDGEETGTQEHTVPDRSHLLPIHPLPVPI